VSGRNCTVRLSPTNADSQFPIVGILIEIGLRLPPVDDAITHAGFESSQGPPSVAVKRSLNPARQSSHTPAFHLLAETRKKSGLRIAQSKVTVLLQPAVRENHPIADAATAMIGHEKDCCVGRQQD